MARTTLDVKGLACPLPVLRANKALKELMAGDEIEVLATDPNAPSDFEAFCETTGHQLVSCEDRNGMFAILIRRAH